MYGCGAALAFRTDLSAGIGFTGSFDLPIDSTESNYIKFFIYHTNVKKITNTLIKPDYVIAIP